VPDRGRLEELERQHQAQLLGLGGLALEMHQRDGIDGEKLMEAASEVAKTERGLDRLEEALERDVGTDELDGLVT
jgi:hypothetical protein